MKTSCLVFVLLSSILAEAQAAGTATQTVLPPPTAYSIVANDANSRIWERTVYEQGPNGTIFAREHRVTELATGLNFWDSTTGQWMESKEEIDVLPQGGAAATNGQHQAYFPGDIYQGEIQMMAPDGVQLQSRPTGIFYDDGTNTVLIAALTNSVGELASPNQIIYPNAFEGIGADLLYTFTKGGFEQDVVLRQQIPLPTAYGLNPQTARLQVLTEFFGPPQPNVTTTTVQTDAGDLTDETLDFGVMKMVQGKAFLMGTTSPTVGVNKQWLLLQGRHFLVEEIPVASVANELETLPVATTQAGSATFSHTASKQLILPPQHLAQTTHVPILVKKAPLPVQGLVLDYQAINGSMTNVNFQADTTYYVSGAANLYGTNTFEGGTVIKFATNASLNLYSIPNCNTAPYRPALLTAKDDDSAGEPLPGSTGSPSGYYANPALNFSGVSAKLSNVSVSYAQQAVEISDNGASGITNAQFVSCANGIEPINDTLTLENVLFGNVLTNFNGLNNSTVNAQHITVNNSACLASLASGSGTVVATNGIFANVTNLSGSVTVTGDHNGFYNCPVFGVNTFTNTFNPFQVVGAGSYYLTNGDAFLNVGTTTIDPSLLASLTNKTSFPPIVYYNATISTATTFSPQAPRDTNAAPNLGYHYDPFDYVFGGTEAQSNITFTAGTAVGWFDAQSGTGYGITLDESVIAAFNGTATAPCWFARYDMVQEGGNGNWTLRGYLAGIVSNGGDSSYTPTSPQAVAQFTKFSSRNYDGQIFRDYNGCLVIQATDCEFWGADGGGYVVSEGYTNCLFFRVPPYGAGASVNSFTMENCTVEGGNLNPLYIGHDGANWPVLIVDCTFDGTVISMDDNSGGNTNVTYCDFNAFLSGSNRLAMLGAHDVTNIISFNWQSSWFGNFYLPTNSPLIQAGGITADKMGLYHFTTQTNQVPETNSVVDIGYHYVATDAYGNPLDSNGDGIPDYLEDANGNGLWDDGETNWALSILVQPTNLLANAGTSPMFSVTAGGITPIQYQWYFNSALQANATNATLTINNVQTNNAGSYYVIVTNNYGSLTSSVAILTVIPPPTVLITNPVNNTVFIASTTNITVTATASDIAGTISQVQFFQGTTSLGIVTNSPYTLVWSNAITGNYGLTAVATDNGLSATSPVVNITITPLFTTNNLYLWLKEDAITGLTNNAPVTNWPDSSGWNYNATQGSAGQQPLYVTNIINGLPAVQFIDGDYLTLPVFLNGTTQAEAFVVLEAATNMPSTRQSLWRFGANNTGNLAYPNTSGNIVEGFGSTWYYDLGVPAQPINQYHVFEVEGGNGSWAAWINGVLQLSTTGNTYGYWTYYPSLGDGGNFAGNIAEVLAFNRALTASERQTVNTYLNGKYGLTPSVPATPSNLMAQAVSPTQIGLTWNEALNQGATQISVERSTNSSMGFAVVAQVANALSYLDTNLTAGTTYYYQARAINLTTWSPYSNETNATTLTTGSSIPLANVLLWLKADTGLEQIGTNTPVNFWADQSGNGNSASQSVAGNEPSWVAGVLNGKPVVRFNGSSSYLNLPSFMSSVTQAEAFVVLKAATNMPAQNAKLWRFGANNTGNLGYPNTGGHIVEGFGSTWYYDLGVPAQPINQYHVFEVEGGNGSWAAWINGVLQLSTTGNTYGYWPFTMTLSEGSTFGGDLAEMLVFSRALTGDEKIAVGNYLLLKYSLSQYAVSTSPPSAPTNLIATGVASYQLNLQWARTSTNETAFDVERKLGSGGTYQEIGSVITSITNFLDTTASPTNEYFYRVKARNYFGQSGYSPSISPPTVGLTNWPAVILENETNLIGAAATDANGTVNSVGFFANNGFYTGSLGTAVSAPYSINWLPTMTGAYSLTALATDSLGNSQYSAPVNVTSYLDANHDGIPDIWEVQSGNDPLNPWLPPAANTNDHTAPIITLLIPTNAVVVP